MDVRDPHSACWVAACDGKSEFAGEGRCLAASVGLVILFAACNQEDGLVSKTIYPELPPRSEYSITGLGMTLIPIIDAMIDWGNANRTLFEKKYGAKE